MMDKNTWCNRTDGVIGQMWGAITLYPSVKQAYFNYIMQELIKKVLRC